MGYGADILKHESAFYTLNNATISDGVLSIAANGSASCDITLAMLASLTESFEFACIVTPFSDSYVPDIVVEMQVYSNEDLTWYNINAFPVEVANDVYSCTFELPAGSYDNFTFTIKASVACVFTLWELRPEALNENIETIINGVTQSLPKLLYDYNTYPFEIGLQESTVGIITCRLLDATDLQGHFLITFMASMTCTVIVRFYDNEAEELFSPLYYDVIAGRNTIGIPHAYLTRKAGLHSFVVTMQAFAGALSVDTRNVLFTIDGGYLAMRELELGMDITDIAIRQVDVTSGPDEIWVVGLDAGELLVRKRDYKETNANVSFDPVATMGKSIGGAIEFNGFWEIHPSATKYTIHTEEEPYIFVIDELGTLRAYHGTEDATPQLIDNSVTMVKACKGFSSIDYPEQDQGLTIAYIKEDGSAWYKQLCWDVSLQDFNWLPQVRIGNDSWDFINVSRLNDYRLSFQLSNSENNVWMYTDRTFVAQATPPEIFTLASELDQYSAWYGPVSARHATEIDEQILVYEYDETADNYRWTISFHIADPVVTRGGADLISYVTVTGGMASNLDMLLWNIETNSIDATFIMDKSPEDVSIVACDLTLNSSDGSIVVSYSNGYYIIGRLTSHFEINNAKYYTVNEEESFSLVYDSRTTQLQYLTLARLSNASYESFLLPSTSALVQQSVVVHTTLMPYESFDLAAGTNLTVTYSGVHVKPI